MDEALIKMVVERLIQQCENGWSNLDTENKMVVISRETQLDLVRIQQSFSNRD